MTIAIATLGGGGGDDSTTNKTSLDNDDIIDIQVTLSRSSFVAGGTVVGTVRLAHRATNNITEQPPRRRIRRHPRDAVSSIALTAVGYCRLDPRWHKETEYHKAYGTTSSQQQHDLSLLNRLSKDTPNRRNIFWASSSSSSASSSSTERGGGSSLELLNLPERTDTSWENVVRPRPIRLGPSKASRTVAEEVEDAVSDDDYADSEEEGHFDEVDLDESSHDVVSNEANDNSNLENRQWASAFRIDLPENLPPTLAATSCRYTYAILVRCVVKNKNNNRSNSARRRPSSSGASSSSSMLNTTVEWVQVPFVVLTTPTSSLTPPQADLLGGVTTINCQAFAHSAGLPFGLTSTEVFYPRSSSGGNLTVHRGGSSFFGNLSHHHPQQQRRRGGQHHHPVHASLQTLRISNPAGHPVAVLTILGGTTTASSALYLSPGSRLILKLDFPKKDDHWTPSSSSSRLRRADGEDHHHEHDNDDGNWVPCYQVSACLQGEEIVVQPDGSRTTRARQHLLSTAHQVMDPACTESLSLDLMVSDNSSHKSTTTPFSLSTNVVEITTRCLVDLTVGVTDGSSSSNGSDMITGYSNLRLEIPIQIGHGASLSMLQDDDQDAEDEQLISTLVDLSSSSPSSNHHDNATNDSFRTLDIRHDLKQLALSMADQCGLSTPS